MNKKVSVAIAVIVVIIIAAIAFEAYKTTYKPTSPPTSVTTVSSTISYPVALTDPPSVPSGTSALWINYSGVELITNSSPLFENITGSVNLLQLINVSKVIAVFNISKTTQVNQIRLIVSSAEIVINGSKYPVFLPSGVLKIPVTNATSGALVDLQPHVVVAYFGQQPEYILTPVATAVPFNTTAKLGQTVPLPSQVIHKLHSALANITIVSASISFKGNVTSISVTIKNNGQEPVVIYAVKIFGEWQTYISAEFNQSFFSSKGFGQMFPQGPPAGFNGSLTTYMPLMFFVYNGSLTPFPAAPINPHGIRFFGPQGRMGPFNFNFTFSINQTALANFTPPVWHGNFGIILQPGQSITLNYTGVITPLKHFVHFRSHILTNLEIYTVPVSGAQYYLRIYSVPPSNSTYVTKAY